MQMKCNYFLFNQYYETYFHVEDEVLQLHGNELLAVHCVLLLHPTTELKKKKKNLCHMFLSSRNKKFFLLLSVKNKITHSAALLQMISLLGVQSEHFNNE